MTTSRVTTNHLGIPYLCPIILIPSLDVKMFSVSDVLSNKMTECGALTSSDMRVWTLTFSTRENLLCMVVDMGSSKSSVFVFESVVFLDLLESRILLSEAASKCKAMKEEVGLINSIEWSKSGDVDLLVVCYAKEEGGDRHVEVWNERLETKTTISKEQCIAGKRIRHNLLVRISHLPFILKSIYGMYVILSLM